MADIKLQNLIDEIENHLAEKTEAGSKIAILEANKVLEVLLDNKKYPGKNLEQKLYWAGFSLKGKDDFASALKKYEEIQRKLEVSLSDFEAREIVNAYLKVIKVIASRKNLTIMDRLKYFLELYFLPTSLLFWRNMGIFFVFWGIIKFLAFTETGLNISNSLISWANFFISWPFFAISVGMISIIWLGQNYFAGKTKIKIKDDISL